MVTCAECNWTMCVGKGDTACVTWDAPTGTPWYCRTHNAKLENFLRVTTTLDINAITHLNFQYKINARNPSFSHGGRVVPPLLYIHIYPCEVLLNKATLAFTNIDGRLHEFYKHGALDLVRSLHELSFFKLT